MISDVLYEPLTLDHLEEILPNIRDIDTEECEDIFGVDIEEGLIWSLEQSDLAYAAKVDGEIVCVFGLVIGETVSTPWLVGTDAIGDNWLHFARASRDIWDSMRDAHGPLANYLKKTNTVHLRWLEWLGCTFEPVPKCPEIVRFLCV